MSSTRFDYLSFRRYLENSCGCVLEHKPIPAPYASEDDLPDLYTSADGKPFAVPYPDGVDNHYSDYLVNKILVDNRLTPRPSSLKDIESS